MDTLLPAAAAKPTKAQRIAEAWAIYRHTTVGLPRLMPWSDYLAADELAWRSYRDRERAILAEKE